MGSIKDLSDLLFQHTTEELQTTCRTVYIQSVQVPELQKATIPVMQTIPHSQVLRPSNILNIPWSFKPQEALRLH